MPIHSKTPLIQSTAFRSRKGSPVWLKLETTQPTGSFKIRGIGHACQEYVKRGAQRLISSSGGNAGLAVAYAGRKLEVPVEVIVPNTTTEGVIERIRAEGAKVFSEGASWDEAHRIALGLSGPTAAYIHPFDDPLIWRGHSTIIDEIVSDHEKPDTVLLSVGGGGLFCGVVEGLLRAGWDDVKLVTAETRGADSLSKALAAGTLIELDAITSIATSLGAKRVAQQAFEYAQSRDVLSIVVSDAQAVSACWKFHDTYDKLVEPACGAALAVLELEERDLEDLGQVVVIVCGGVGVSKELLVEWRKTAM